MRMSDRNWWWIAFSLIVLSGQGLRCQSGARDAVRPVLSAAVLVDRIVAHAGGEAAFAKIQAIRFRKTTLSSRPQAVAGLWLLSPAGPRARWESESPRAPKINRNRRASRPSNLKVLDTKTRKNLLSLPEWKGPQISLWGEWHRTHRLLFLPFMLKTATALELLPERVGDRPGQRRLRAVWPKTQNYVWVDAHELLIEVDTGRIAQVVEISGAKGERRVALSVSRWRRVGGMRLPSVFKVLSGRGVGMEFDFFCVNPELPRDVWTRAKKLLLNLAPAPAPTPRSVGAVVRVKIEDEKHGAFLNRRLHFCVFENGAHDQIYVGTKSGLWSGGEFDLSIDGRVVFTGRIKRLVDGGVMLLMGDILKEGRKGARGASITRVQGDFK